MLFYVVLRRYDSSHPISVLRRGLPSVALIFRTRTSFVPAAKVNSHVATAGKVNGQPTAVEF